MPYSFSDEAIVLRTYNVGESDRFCILLTKEHGKIVARAQGVRRLTSRRGSGLLPLHRIALTLEKHSFGLTISHAECLSSHASAWSDAHAFSAVVRGIELLLKCTDEGVPLPEAYALTTEFLSACHAGHGGVFPLSLVPIFSLKLLDIFGLLPSVHISCISHVRLRDDETVLSTSRGGFCSRREDPSGLRLSFMAHHVLATLDLCSLTTPPPCDARTAQELDHLVQGFVGNQLGSSLVAPPVSFAIASGVTPICQ